MDLFLGTYIKEKYVFIKKMQNVSPQDIQNWQLIQLRKLLTHFKNTFPYFKRIMEEKNIDPGNIKSLEDIKTFPVITKDIIKDNYESLITKASGKIKFKLASTGGSTGKPLKYPLDLESWSYSTASNIYYFEQNGLLFGMKYMALGSSSLFPEKKTSLKHKLYYFLKKKISVNGVNMSEDSMRAILKIIQRKKIRFLYGYASSIYLLAKFAKENHINIDLKACFPTSEILTDNYRKTIIDSFNCKVVDGYGARDGGIVAYETHPYNYNVGYNTIVETVNDLGENTGKILLTDLFNFACPFIRYELGDSVSIESRDNNLYNGQIITKIIGRNSSVIKLENGNTLTGPGFTILFKDLNVKAYRISKPLPLVLNIEIIPDNEYSTEEEALILKTFQKHAGSDCKINLIKNDKLSFMKSGKSEYLIV